MDEGVAGAYFLAALHEAIISQSHELLAAVQQRIKLLLHLSKTNGVVFAVVLGAFRAGRVEEVDSINGFALVLCKAQQ